MESFVIIGMGRFGSAVATELFCMKRDVLVLDEHEECIAPVMDYVTESIIGDAKDETVLRSLGIQNFDCVVVAIANKLEDSILITMMLKEMGAKFVVCKAQNELHAKILTQLGADKVVRPEFDMGRQLAHSLGVEK